MAPAAYEGGSGLDPYSRDTSMTERHGAGEASQLPTQTQGNDKDETNPLSDKATAAAAGSAGDTTASPTIEEDPSPGGPYLQFLGYDLATRQWKGSLLMVLGCFQEPAPVPTLIMDDEGRRTQAPLVRLDAGVEKWACWRFEFTFTLGPQQRCINYEVSFQDPSGAPDTRSRFWLPAATQSWAWAFHSCNGLSMNADLEKWGAPHLWEDVLAVHNQSPLHACVGGGDQVYSDGVWKETSLVAWLDISSTDERYSHPFTAEMGAQAMAFYFNHYRAHFQTPVIARVMACIPQVMIWDDHDIWDGWGSYPEKIQNCPVFRGLYDVARFQYLLWQQHCNLHHARQANDYFGPPDSFSFMRQLGPSTCLLCPDTRAHRSTHQILAPATYEAMFSGLSRLPPETKHVVCLFTVPLVWPKLPLSEGVMTVVDGLPILKGVMTKTGLGAGIVDKFGHAELLDDITDGWEATPHKAEREMLITRMQALAKERQLRISFLSGDVHCCGVGRLYTRPKVRHLRNDYRFMPQITSSAIWNAPPPDTLMTLQQKTNRSHKIMHHTGEKMVRLFYASNPKSPKLLNRRNWCLVSEASSGIAQPAWQGEQGALIFTLRVEDPDNQKAVPEQFHTIVPPLELHLKGMRPSLRSKSWGKRLGWGSAPNVLDPLAEL